MGKIQVAAVKAHDEILKRRGEITFIDAFVSGYRQAEKDLALNWEDIAKIDALILEANNEFAVDYSKEISREQFYTEVLNRFNKSKEE